MENNNKIKVFIWIVVILAVVLAIFAFVRGRKNTSVNQDINAEEYVTSEAMVDSFDIVINETFPVSVSVNIKGNLADPCVELVDPKQQLVGDTFNIIVEGRKLKDGDVVCAQVLQPFETSVNLQNVIGLSAGEYSVNVHGDTKTFVIDVDNYISNVDPLK